MTTKDIDLEAAQARLMEYGAAMKSQAKEEFKAIKAYKAPALPPFPSISEYADDPIIMEAYDAAESAYGDVIERALNRMRQDAEARQTASKAAIGVAKSAAQLTALLDLYLDQDDPDVEEKFRGGVVTAFGRSYAGLYSRGLVGRQRSYYGGPSTYHQNTRGKKLAEVALGLATYRVGDA